MSTYVQSKVADLGSVTSGNVTYTNTTVSANISVAVARVTGTGRTLTVTDSKSNTYTQRANQVQTTDGHELIAQDAANMVGGASHQVTFAISGGATTMRVGIMEGAPSNTTPFDKTAQAQANGSTTPSSGATATTSQATEWLVGLISTAGLAGDTGLTGGTGYTVREQLTAAGLIKLCIEERDVVATGTYAADGTFAASDNYAAIILTYKVGGGGGGATFFSRYYYDMGKVA